MSEKLKETKVEKGENGSLKVTLVEPIVFGETTVDKFTLRKPKTKDLRGLDLDGDLTKVDTLVDLMVKLSPELESTAMVDEMAPEDFIHLSNSIALFLAPSQGDGQIA